MLWGGACAVPSPILTGSECTMIMMAFKSLVVVRMAGVGSPFLCCEQHAQI